MKNSNIHLIEKAIKDAFTAPNGMGPTAVTVENANDQEIKISFNMPSPKGVTTKFYPLDESGFSKMIGARVSGISFDDVLNAYLESKTQLNDVADLREQATGTDTQQQAEATEVKRTVPAEESDHRGIIEQNRDTAEVAQNSR